MRLYDVIVIGGGVQAALCLDQMRAQGLSAFCVAGNFEGGLQTSSSQLYLHGGYFYRDDELIPLLQSARRCWDVLIDRFDLSIHHGKSLVGFKSKADAQANLDVWRKHSLDFEEVELDKDHAFRGGDIGYYLRVNEMWLSNSNFVKQVFNKLGGNFEHSLATEISSENHGYCVRTTGSVSSLWAPKIVLCAGADNQKLIRMCVGSRGNGLQQQRHCQVLVLEGKLPFESIICPSIGHFICPAPLSSGSNVLRCTYGFDYPMEIEEKPAPSLNLERLGTHIIALRNSFPALCSATTSAGWYTVLKSESYKDGLGKRPNKHSVELLDEGVIAVWPTKMTLAPLAAQEVISQICQSKTIAGFTT